MLTNHQKIQRLRVVLKIQRSVVDRILLTTVVLRSNSDHHWHRAVKRHREEADRRVA